ncbi:nucleoside triphosphate pyrophosphohydrolase [bacterium]|nr:nucleoside triphosphate pyrophosphohydrolase [bacterium]
MTYEKAKYDFDACVAIIRRLRGPGGCPWDNEQTYESLRKYFLEEVYEALDAIDRRDFPHLKEELGDVLWEILFLARIAEQDGHFDTSDVCQVLGEKMVRRHPHIFGDTVARDADHVIEMWSEIKKSEKRDAPGTGGVTHVLDKVPQALPALLRAFRVGERAAKEGFDWARPSEVLDKVREELAELEEAIETGDADRVEDELGDIIFALVNLGRHTNVSAEDGLRRTMAKFADRFSQMEDRLAAQGRRMRDCSIDELEAFWQAIKAERR